MLSWVEIKDLCSEFMQKRDWESLVRLLMVEFLWKLERVLSFFLMSIAQGQSGSASRGAEWLRWCCEGSGDSGSGSNFKGGGGHESR